MALYEVMFIAQPDWEGEVLEEAIQKVKDVIEKEQGTVVLSKKLGKRRLAYAIKDYREGSYVLFNVRAGREFIPVLEHFFRVNEGYLRYIVIRLEKGLPEENVATAPVEEIPVEDVDAEAEAGAGTETEAAAPAGAVTKQATVAVDSSPAAQDVAGDDAGKIEGTGEIDIPEAQDETPGEE
ncbi:MAG: 30S ribosomal protein S6 [Firmicutes bacterium]|nr:30S ribosomal protein S6 [Bacillota bacterium]